jgi:predicted glutamine amidotransferase
VFADMARLHRDGWGTAWRGKHRLGVTVRPHSGIGDADLEDTLVAGPSTARLVHLRLATRGMACTTANTHPFVVDGMAFAHNGSFQPNGAVDRLIGGRQRAGIEGTTDSERYFAAIRTRMDEGATAFEAALDTVAALRAAFPDRSLNALLLTDDELIAVHASEGVPIPHHEFAASGIPSHRLPRHHEDAYYLMRSKRGPDGSVVVASSGLDITGWEPLPAESVTSFDLATLESRTEPLAAAGSRTLVA